MEIYWPGVPQPAPDPLNNIYYHIVALMPIIIDVGLSSSVNRKRENIT